MKNIWLTKHFFDGFKNFLHVYVLNRESIVSNHEGTDAEIQMSVYGILGKLNGGFVKVGSKSWSLSIRFLWICYNCVCCYKMFLRWA